MTANPSVILTGFADEAANQKTAEQQFAAFAALGLQYYTIRFIDAGKGIKNVMQLTKGEINTVRHLEADSAERGHLANVKPRARGVPKLFGVADAN